MLILFLIASSLQLKAQQDDAPVEMPVVGFFKGLSLLNEYSQRHYGTKDFKLSEDGQVWNIDTLVNRVMPRKNSGITRVNEFKFINNVRKGEMAWVSYHNAAEFKQADRQQTVRWISLGSQFNAAALN